MRVGQIVQRKDGPELREILQVENRYIRTEWWMAWQPNLRDLWSDKDGWTLAPWGAALAFRAAQRKGNG
jgi:hypothetical protein